MLTNCKNYDKKTVSQEPKLLSTRPTSEQQMNPTFKKVANKEKVS